MVISHDLAPTLIALGGGEPLADVTGQVVEAAAARDGAPDWRTAFFYEYNYETQFPYTPNVRGVRTDRWKLIRYPHGDGTPDRYTAELYDLAHDPQELHNLIADPAHAATRRELERRFEEVSREAGPDQMPVYAGIVDVRPVH